jgi:hypothetical protein
MDKNIHSKVIQIQCNLGANRWAEEMTWGYDTTKLDEIAKEIELFLDHPDNQDIEWRVVVIEEYIRHTEEEFVWENYLA